MSKVTLYMGVCFATAAKGAADELGKIAEQVAGDARGSVPVESGEWRAGISGGQEGDIGMVRSSDPESFWKEYGTSDTPAHMTLTNAARKYGKYSGMSGR
ncbi:MAG: HK97 gp10 family phage protein [Pseudonocardiaceae bacterium]|nr:MAG: HK97 gp10 family phage protein [Pseudonocardiaceae bacterium]